MARVLDKGVESRPPPLTHGVALGKLLLHLSLPLSCKMGILLCALTYSPGHCHQVGSSRSRSSPAPASSPGIQDSRAKMAAILPKGGPPQKICSPLGLHTLQRRHRYFFGHWAWWITEGWPRKGCPGRVRPRHPSGRSSLWPMPPVFLITDFSLAERAEGPLEATWKAFPQQDLCTE